MSSTDGKTASPVGTRRRVLWSTLDQALSSASNFALVFLVARGTTPAELGYIFIAYSVLTAGVVVSRNAFGGILGIDLPTIDKDAASVLLTRSIGAVLLASTLVSATLLVLAFALPLTSAASAVVVILAVSAPIVLFQDLQRFWAVADGRSHHAVISDGLWLLMAMAGFWISQVGAGLSDAAWGAACWVAGGAMGGLALAWFGYVRKPRFSGTWAWATVDTRRRQLAADALIGQLSPLGTMSVIAGVAGPQVLAAVRSAATLFGPLNLLSATIPLALVPEAIRSGARRAQRLFLATTLGYAAVAVALGVLLYAVPESLGSALLGTTFPLAQTVVLITMMEYIGLGMWGVSRARFRVGQRLGTALRFRVIYSASAVILPVASVLIWGSARALAASMAITALGVGGAAYIASRHRTGAS